MRWTYPKGQAPQGVQAPAARNTPRRKAVQSPEVFLAALRQRGLPQPHREYRFAEPRKFRADFCWPSHGVLVEVEGGIFTRQAHGSITGMLRDIQKYNLAAVHGYRVLRCVPDDLCSETFLSTIHAVLTTP